MRTAASGATRLASSQAKNAAHCDRISGAGVRVADVGGEEIEEAQNRVLAGVRGRPTHASPSNIAIAEALPTRRKRAIRGASPAAIQIALKTDVPGNIRQE